MMSPDRIHEEPARDPIIVRIAHDRRGGWVVAMPDGPGAIACETIDDARRIAYLCAARTRRCELIVHDAYDRVLSHELIDGNHDSTPSRPGATRSQPASQGGR